MSEWDHTIVKVINGLEIGVTKGLFNAKITIGPPGEQWFKDQW